MLDSRCGFFQDCPTRWLTGHTRNNDAHHRSRWVRPLADHSEVAPTPVLLAGIRGTPAALLASAMCWPAGTRGGVGNLMKFGRRPAQPPLVRLAIMCLNLHPLAGGLKGTQEGRDGSSLAKGVPPPTVPVHFLRRLVSWRVGSAGSTRAAFSARLHLTFSLDS